MANFAMEKWLTKGSLWPAVKADVTSQAQKRGVMYSN